MGLSPKKCCFSHVCVRSHDFCASFWACGLKSVAFHMSVSGPVIFCESFWACRAKKCCRHSSAFPSSSGEPSCYIHHRLLLRVRIREMISSSSTVEKGLPQSILLSGNGPDVTDPDSLLESTFKKFKRQIKRYVTDNDQTEQM